MLSYVTPHKSNFLPPRTVHAAWTAMLAAPPFPPGLQATLEPAAAGQGVWTDSPSMVQKHPLRSPPLFQMLLLVGALNGIFFPPKALRRYANATELVISKIGDRFQT